MRNFIMKNDKAGHGEDAAYVCDNFAVVCDGLGGSGNTPLIYGGSKYTEAHIASTLCCAAVKDFFNDFVADEYSEFLNDNRDPNERREFLEEMVYALREHIEEYMTNKCIENDVDMDSIKALPTTLALAVYCETEEGMEVTAIWAGDSRVYTLSPTGGLQQLSRDDTVAEEFDANEQIGTCQMTGCVTLTSPFELNFLHYQFEKTDNRFIFCCSDGCYDGLKSIMLLEYILLSQIMGLDDDEAPENFIENVKKAYVLGEVYGEGLIDDTSLAGAIFSHTKTKEMKKQFLARYANLKEIHEIVSNWQDELREIDRIRPTKYEDEQIMEEFGEFALEVAEKSLSSLPVNWEDQIFSEMIASLPVFEKYHNRREEIMSVTRIDIPADTPEYHDLREEFKDAFLKLLCVSRENRDYALRKLDKTPAAAQLSYELENFALQYEAVDSFEEMRSDIMEMLYDTSCFYSIFEDGTASRAEFLEALSDTAEQIACAAELANKLLNSNGQVFGEQQYEMIKNSLMEKLDEYGIYEDGFTIWATMGYPPFGDSENCRVFEELIKKLELGKREIYEAEIELNSLLADIVYKNSYKIVEQFINSPEIVYNSYMDDVDGIEGLREWLSMHKEAEKASAQAYEQVSKIWRFHYKAMYEQYKKAQTSGRV